jgi:hypothetical protein
MCFFQYAYIWLPQSLPSLITIENTTLYIYWKKRSPLAEYSCGLMHIIWYYFSKKYLLNMCFVGKYLQSSKKIFQESTRKALMQSIKGRRQKNLIQVCT